MFNDTVPSTPPKQTLLVRMRAGASKLDREDVINGLRNFIPDSTVLVFDTHALLDATDVAVSMLVLFFNIVAAIAVFLCFFLLWLSFTANVRENAWEFGVLRAVGLSVRLQSPHHSLVYTRHRAGKSSERTSTRRSPSSWPPCSRARSSGC